MTAPMGIAELRDLVHRHGGDSLWGDVAVAGALTESGGVPDAKAGGNEDSWGLWQMNRGGGMGTGYSVAQLCDPDFAASIMVPVYIANAKRASNLYDNDDDRATWTYLETEKPYGYPDPALQSAAAHRFRTNWLLVEGTDGSPAQPPDDAEMALRQAFMAELESNAGTPYVFGGKVKGSYDCSGLLTDAARRVGLDLGDPMMTSADALKLYCDAIDPAEARLGDLILFYGTYGDFGRDYATHCGASYGAGTLRMSDTHGDPWPGCGTTDISTAYWQGHFLGVWRPRGFASAQPAPPPDDGGDVSDESLINRLGYIQGDVANAIASGLDGLDRALAMPSRSAKQKDTRLQAITDAVGSIRAGLNTLRTS